MSTKAALGIGLTWFLLPAGVVVGYVFLGTVTATGTELQLAEQVNALVAAALVLPIAGLCAAVLGSRLRQSRILSGAATVRRTWLRVFAAVVLPLWLVAIMALLLPVLAFTSPETHTWLPHPIVLSTVAMQALACTALGVGLGKRLQPLVAVPAAALLPFVLIGFPPAMQPVWLRFLTSLPSFCCQVYDRPDPRAIAGLVMFSFALSSLGFALFVPGDRARISQVVAITVFVACAAGAIICVRPLPTQAVVARSGSPQCQPVGQTSLCLWPEHERYRAEATPLLKRVDAVGKRTGVLIPTAFSEVMPDDVSWPQVTVDLSPGLDRRAWVFDALDPAMTCRLRRPPEGGDRGEARNDASDALRYWWARELGRTELPRLTREAADLLERADRGGAEEVNALMRRSAQIACGSDAQ